MTACFGSPLPQLPPFICFFGDFIAKKILRIKALFGSQRFQRCGRPKPLGRHPPPHLPASLCFPVTSRSLPASSPSFRMLPGAHRPGHPVAPPDPGDMFPPLKGAKQWFAEGGDAGGDPPDHPRAREHNGHRRPPPHAALLPPPPHLASRSVPLQVKTPNFICVGFFPLWSYFCTSQQLFL